MNEKKVFTESEIKEALYSVYSKQLYDDTLIQDNHYFCGFTDALIGVYCHIFDTDLCPVNFGVVEKK